MQDNLSEIARHFDDLAANPPELDSSLDFASEPFEHQLASYEHEDGPAWGFHYER